MATEQDVRGLIAAGDEALADAAFRTGDFGKARELLEAAHTEAARGDDASEQASALDALGMLAHYENITKLMGGSAVSESDIEAEERLFRRALSRWQEAGDPPDSAQSLFGLGLVYQVLHSDWTTAMPYYWQALGLITGEHAAGPYLRSEVHRHVGFYFLVEASQPAEAVRHLQISLDLREEHGDPRRIPSGLVALARAELEAGGRDRAIELLRRAVAESHEAGLLSEWIKDAERTLAEAEGDTDADAASGPGPDVPETQPRVTEADADTGAGAASSPAPDKAETDTDAGPASNPPPDVAESQPGPPKAETPPSASEPDTPPAASEPETPPSASEPDTPPSASEPETPPSASEPHTPPGAPEADAKPE